MTASLEYWRTYYDRSEKREWQVRYGELFCRRCLPRGFTDWQKHTTIPVRLRKELNELFDHPTERPVKLVE